MHDCVSRRQLQGHRIPVCRPDRAARSSASVRARNRPPATGGRRTPTSSTPGSLRRCGRSPRSAGRMRRRSSRSSIRTVFVTGYDILLRVVRMMMFGLYAMDGVQPFDIVLLHGMDLHGKKMSKSRGNTGPIRSRGWTRTAPTRCASRSRGANPGRTSRSGRSACGSTQPCNKLWNAARFALINVHQRRRHCRRAERQGADRWILSRFQQVIAEVDANYDDFQFARARETLYHLRLGRVLRLVRRTRQGVARASATRRRTLASSSVMCSMRCCACCIRSRRTSLNSCGRR